MSIQPVQSSRDTLPVAPASSLASSERPVAVDPDATASASVWVSPPGLFFSVLHQISQEYPVELKTALAGVVVPPATATPRVGGDGGSVTTPPRVETESPTYAPEARVPVRDVRRPSMAPTHDVHVLMDGMRELAHRDPASFEDLALQVAASFTVVADQATGAGVEAMANLASQLNQAAGMSAGPPRADVPAADDRRRIAAVTAGVAPGGVGDDGLSSPSRDPRR